MSSPVPTRQQSVADVEALQDRVVAFVRAFGLHQPDTTPCGRSIPTSQAHALTELASHQPMSQSQLCSQLKLSKSTVSRMVGVMERAGWVERERGTHTDGRMVALRLTPEGQRLAATVIAARRERMGRLLERIPDNRKTSVLQALSILAEAADD